MARRQNGSRVHAALQKLLRDAEADARSCLPRPTGRKPVRRKETLEIIPAKPLERRVGIVVLPGVVPRPRSYKAVTIENEYDPDKHVARYTREQLLEPVRLDLESLHARNGTGGLPLKFYDQIFQIQLAGYLLALCRYAKAHKLTPEEHYIVGYNVAALRAGLRYPQVRKAAGRFQKREQRAAQQIGYDKLREFVQDDAKKRYKKQSGIKRIALAREYIATINPQRYGLRKMPSLRTINQVWLKGIVPN